MNLLEYFVSKNFNHLSVFTIETPMGQYTYRLHHLDDALYNIVIYNEYQIIDLIAPTRDTDPLGYGNKRSYKHLLPQIIDDINEHNLFKQLSK